MPANAWALFEIEVEREREWLRRHDPEIKEAAELFVMRVRGLDKDEH